jgi:hypothetical protein
LRIDYPNAWHHMMNHVRTIFLRIKRRLDPQLDFANIKNIFKFLTQRTLDYCFEAKASKHFKIFTKISKDTDGVYFNNADMYRKFGIEKIIES